MKNVVEMKKRVAVQAKIMAFSLSMFLPLVVMAGDVPVVEQHGAQVIELEGGRNFRDLGGYKTEDGRTVKSGLLFRSGVLTNLTAGDYEIIADLGIATIIDFRSTEERYSEPTFWHAGPVEVYARDYDMGLENGDFVRPFMKPELTLPQAEAIMASMYPGMLEQQNESYRAMFDELLEEEAPLLFHCSAGKDRTGIAAALLLTALGVDRETVVADYVVSEKILGRSLMTDQNENRSADAIAGLPAPAIEALMGTRRSYIEAAFTAMERQSGSVRGYLHEELDLSDQDLDKLRKNYLQ